MAVLDINRPINETDSRCVCDYSANYRLILLFFHLAYFQGEDDPAYDQRVN